MISSCFLTISFIQRYNNHIIDNKYTKEQSDIHTQKIWVLIYMLDLKVHVLKINYFCNDAFEDTVCPTRHVHSIEFHDIKQRNQKNHLLYTIKKAMLYFNSIASPIGCAFFWSSDPASDLTILRQKLILLGNQYVFYTMDNFKIRY